MTKIVAQHILKTLHYKNIKSIIKGSVKKFLFIYNFLRGFFILKVFENSPQNARNCTIFKNFLVGACPETP